MKLNPQQHKIYDLHSIGDWVCSTRYEFIRDHRKRISEMNRMNRLEKGVDLFEAERCDKSCGVQHKANVFMRRLKVVPKKQIIEYTDHGTVKISYT